MSSPIPPDSDLPRSDSESPTRDRFQTAAAEKMQADRNAPPERSLWQGGYSPKAMYGTWATAAALTVVAIVLVAIYGAQLQNVWLITMAVILLGWCVIIGLYLSRRWGVHYELTTQRFVHQEGIFVRRSNRIEVIDIDDVSYTQGIVQRMLGVGTIVITGSDRSHPELVIQGIDRVPEIASLIDDVRREERRRRSLHIEAI